MHFQEMYAAVKQKEAEFFAHLENLKGDQCKFLFY